MTREFAVAPEAVWQIGRPPYQSEIWYGGAISIRDAGITAYTLVVIRRKDSYFTPTFTNLHLNSASIKNCPSLS